MEDWGGVEEAYEYSEQVEDVSSSPRSLCISCAYFGLDGQERRQLLICRTAIESMMLPTLM